MSRKRLPGWLKRPLLPIWNAGHQFAWCAREQLDAARLGRFGWCEVCGRFGPRLYRRRVVPPKLEELWGLSPRLAAALARKESTDCGWCGAKLRARRLARVVLDLYPVGTLPGPARSIADWVRSAEAAALRVAEVNRIDGLHEVLDRLATLTFSDFDPSVPPGATVQGVRSEDLARLTYPDAAFDLVLTSESLEHVPDFRAALSEIRRVLAPGGRHVFTIPLLPGVATTYARSMIRPDGAVEHIAPRIKHPGGDVGYPVFTEFGADFPEILRQIGFEVNVLWWPPTEDDLAQVFVCRKPSARRRE